MGSPEAFIAGPSLADMIAMAKITIDRWPDDVRIAMGLAPRVAHEPHICIDNKYHIGAKERCSRCTAQPPRARPWEGKRVYIIPVLEQGCSETVVDVLLRANHLTFWVDHPTATKCDVPPAGWECTRAAVPKQHPDTCDHPSVVNGRCGKCGTPYFGKRA